MARHLATNPIEVDWDALERRHLGLPEPSPEARRPKPPPPPNSTKARARAFAALLREACQAFEVEHGHEPRAQERHALKLALREAHPELARPEVQS